MILKALFFFDGPRSEQHAGLMSDPDCHYDGKPVLNQEPFRTPLSAIIYQLQPL